MLTIRLARIGKKKQPTYRLIINEKTKDTFGDFLENLGNYNPRTKEINLKTDRIKYWISKGAQTSDTVHNLLVKNKVIDSPKVKAWRPKKRKSADSSADEAGEAGKEKEGDEKKSDDKKPEKEASEAPEESKDESKKPEPEKTEESKPEPKNEKK